MDGFERRRLASLAKQLEQELRGSRLPDAKQALGEMQWLFDKIDAGTFSPPIKKAPGKWHFTESDLRGDARLSNLWMAFSRAVRQQ
ncbi:MAG: hypothetical protein ACI9MR_004146 [Myxococcota bacterium]|jgi:hypothetical protein